jgi:hypothetical protein
MKERQRRMRETLAAQVGLMNHMPSDMDCMGCMRRMGALCHRERIRLTAPSACKVSGRLSAEGTDDSAHTSIQ